MNKNTFKILGLLFAIISLTNCLIGCEKQEQPANTTAETVTEIKTEEITTEEAATEETATEEAATEEITTEGTEETLYIEGIIDELNEEYEGYFHIEIVGKEE